MSHMQTPPTHDREHGLLHRPQCCGLLPMRASQPFDGSPSQSAKPSAHSAHAPRTHRTPAAHAAPHAPQCAALVRVSTSQPLAALPSQSPNAPRQSGAHRPATHAGCALGVGAHAIPQQFATVIDTHARSGGTSGAVASKAGASATASCGPSSGAGASAAVSGASAPASGTAGPSTGGDGASAPASPPGHTQADHTPSGPHSCDPAAPPGQAHDSTRPRAPHDAGGSPAQATRAEKRATMRVSDRMAPCYARRGAGVDADRVSRG